ncbi:MAG TPA: ATP-dependent DNA helicase RecG [Luteibaculaceae bacterium]|nr:ATP-dependent DNA helicase RecG [Luteibaculaceae bacterium]
MTAPKPIEFLKGVGPERAKLLREELGIFSADDLVNWYPYRYLDRTKYYKIAEIGADEGYVQFVAVLQEVKELGDARRKRLAVKAVDETGEIDLVWFQGIRYIKPNLIAGKQYVIFGKPSLFQNKINFAHPEVEPWNPQRELKTGLQPLYSSTEKLGHRGLNSRGLERVIRPFVLSPDFQPTETLPEYIRHDAKLIGLKDAYIKIHAPENQKDVFHAQRRLKFEELFFMQLMFARQKVANKSRNRGFIFGEVGVYFNRFYNEVLDFELTQAQKRVVKEIRADCKQGHQMNRLLQGDVGSGKTIVAVLSCLFAIDNGYQACLMAPTEILATQHFQGIRGYFAKLGLQCALLTGSTKKSERNVLHEGLREGSIHLLIGTHALLEDVVQYKNLGLAIIDEQHRFGVEQRARLWKKNTLPPHVLVMTATPIPRTLAMTLYGDLDVSVLDELPVGRKPIKTLHKTDSHRLEVFGFMDQQIGLGRQVYIVYPLIEESETMDYKDLMDGYESITRRFPLPQYRVSIVHGKMKPIDKEYEMQRFLRGECQIMVATTVIEVGVNVPNASVMIIENAERFGLSQLHQLRGRVGRGAEQSYCILMTGHKLSHEGKLRLKTMCETNDGFKIAEVDLKLRGPGDILGTQQSGVLQLKMADLAQDAQALAYARELAIKIVTDDPQLTDEKNVILRQHVLQLQRNHSRWANIL